MLLRSSRARLAASTAAESTASSPQVHFDDVPYLHQHLVANLPESVAEPIEPAECSAGAVTDAHADEPAGAGASIAAGGESTAARDVLLYISDASHAAAAVESLRRFQDAAMTFEPGAAEVRSSRRTSRRSCDGIVLQPCVADAVDSATKVMATITSLLEALPSRVLAQSAVRCSELEGLSAPASRPLQAVEAALARLPPEAAAAAEAAAVLLHTSTWLRSKPATTAAAGRLLLVCVDETDPRTMAAALGARLSNGSVVNVCDEPREDQGSAPLPSMSAAAAPGGAAEARRLLSAAAGCREYNETELA